MSVQKPSASLRDRNGRVADTEGWVVGDGGVYVRAARRMNGVVKPLGVGRRC